jgi:hypothetical protein
MYNCCFASVKIVTLGKQSKYKLVQQFLEDGNLTEFEKVTKSIDMFDLMQPRWGDLALNILSRSQLRKRGRYLTALLLKLESMKAIKVSLKDHLMESLKKANYTQRTVKLLLAICQPSLNAVQDIWRVTVEDDKKIMLNHLLEGYIHIRLCMRVHGMIPLSIHAPTPACKEYCRFQSGPEHASFLMACGENFVALGENTPTDQIFRVISLLTHSDQSQFEERIRQLTLPENLHFVVAVLIKDQLHIVKSGNTAALVYTDISQEQIANPAQFANSDFTLPPTASISASVNGDSPKISGYTDMSYCMTPLHHKDFLIMVSEKVRKSVEKLDITGVLQFSSIEERRDSCHNLTKFFDSKIGSGEQAMFCMASFIKQ